MLEKIKKIPMAKTAIIIVALGIIINIVLMAGSSIMGKWDWILLIAVIFVLGVLVKVYILDNPKFEEIKKKVLDTMNSKE